MMLLEIAALVRVDPVTASILGMTGRAKAKTEMGFPKVRIVRLRIAHDLECRMIQ
jgi:hypothetical protein